MALDPGRVSKSCFPHASLEVAASAEALRDALDAYEAATARAKSRRDELVQAALRDEATVSPGLRWIDERGVTWRYVVKRDGSVRVDGCEGFAGGLLAIPGEIQGRTVESIAASACANLLDAEEIELPDSVASIGAAAFRNCKALRSITFPPRLDSFDAGWLAGCCRIERIVLPGALEVIDRSVFSVGRLKVVEIGAGTRSVQPGAFSDAELAEVIVSPLNRHLSTDGFALFGDGGRTLIALAVPCGSYRIPDGCEKLAPKAFAGMRALEAVDLPQGLRSVGDLAFANTSITSFDAPLSLEHIGERAFLRCSELVSVELGASLKSIGAGAFTGSRVERLHLPRTVESIGFPLALEGASAVGSAYPELIVEEGGPLSVDRFGGMYTRGEEGLAFVRMLNPEATSYEVSTGTIAIQSAAFAGHENIAEVHLPPGLRKIGSAAFKGCRGLTKADLPSSVMAVEAEAFMDTSLSSLHIPASLTDVGEGAFVTFGAHCGATRARGSAPSITDLTCDNRNERFYVSSGLLIERKEDGGHKVVLCRSDSDVAIMPDGVDEIAPYAFSGVSGLRELSLPDGVSKVGIRGLAVGGFVELIRIRSFSPETGGRVIELRFPNTDRGAHQLSLALCVPESVSVCDLLGHYDNAIACATSFDAQNESGMRLYEQGSRLLARLADPLFLSEVSRSVFSSFLHANAVDVCMEFARRGDRESISSLIDMGFVNGDNIDEVISRASSLRDAVVTGFLLEASRLRLGRDPYDLGI